MITIHITDRSNQPYRIDGEPGLSLMENIRRGGIDELLALCGGACSCCTCHVTIAPEWADRVGPATGVEADLLEGSTQVGPRSRLSCQITVTEVMDGLQVTVAPED